MPVASALGISVFDEARELVRRLAHRDDRAGVVHAHRSDHRHGTELSLSDAVSGRHERKRAHGRDLVLATDAYEYVSLTERGTQNAQERHAALEQANEPLQLRGILDLTGREQARGPIDVQLVLGICGEIAERRDQPRQEREFGRGQAGVDQALLEHPRAEPETDEALAQILLS